MKLQPRLGLALVVLLPAFAGCIQQSDTRSYYLHADGKIDVLMLLDGIHSTESGPQRVEEERKWLAEFNRRATPELKRLKDAAARDTQVRLLRAKPPYAVLVQGRLENSKSLSVFLDLSPSDPKSSVTFVKDGKLRTLAIHAEKSKAAPAGAKEKALSAEEVDAGQRIFWQFIPLGGSITATKACLVSQDKRSCRLDVAEVLGHDKNGGAEEVSISWQLD